MNSNNVALVVLASMFTIVHAVFGQTSYSITPKPAAVFESAGSVTFTIARSGGTLPAETIYASTTQGEGYSNNSDYTDILNQSVSFTSGQITSDVTVTILDDSTVEANETFGFIVQRNTSDPITTYLAKSTFTIVNDDAPTAYSITPNPATVSESAGSVTFTIARSGGTLPAETIYASTTQGEGYSNNSDYTDILNQSVSFTSGQITSDVTVTILDDSTRETNETFGFIVQRNTSDPITTYLAKSTFTIIDDDTIDPPRISNPRLTGTTFTLSVPTEVGFSYVLEFKNTVTDASWSPVSTNNGTGAMIGLTNSGATGPGRLYRVRVQ